MAQDERDRADTDVSRQRARTVPLPEPLVQSTAACAPPEPITSAPSAITAPLVRFIVNPSFRRVFYRIMAGGATSAARPRAAAARGAQKRSALRFFFNNRPRLVRREP